MDQTRTYWGTLAAIAISLLAGIMVWALLRPPAATAGPQVVDDIDLTGQMRGIVAETIQAVTALTAITPETPTADIQHLRSRVSVLSDGCQRLAESFDHVTTSWIPVAEARLLLERTSEFGTDALARVPGQQVSAQTAAAASPTERDTSRTGLTPETSAILQTRASQLLAESQQLRQSVRQAALTAAFTRGTWAGFEARDYMLALLIIVSGTGAAAVWRYQKRVAVNPFAMVHQELKLTSERHPDQAVDECYRLSRELLQLADRILMSVHSVQ